MRSSGTDALFNLQAERALLSAVIREPAIMGTLGENFRPDLFVDPGHVSAVVCFIEAVRKNPAAKQNNLLDALAEAVTAGALPEDAAQEILATPAVAAGYHASLLIELRLKRSIFEVCRETMGQLERGEGHAAAIFKQHFAAVEAVGATSPSSIEKHGEGEGGAPVLTCLADVEPRQVDWLWHGRIPLGRLTLFVGLPGEGKSFCTVDMAAHITTGTPWPDGAACPLGSVILISAEDDAGDTIRPRMDAAGADVRRVHLLSGVQWATEDGGTREVCFTLDNLAALEEALKRHPDCKLIVIDPIGSYLGGDTDSHRDNEVRAVLAPVAKLAERYGPAVLIVAHRRKSAGTRADDLAIGSRAFTGIARACWHLSRDPENKERRLFLPGKNNLAREGDGLAFTIDGDPPRLWWESGPVHLNADEGLAAENAGEDRPGPKPEARSAAEGWLRELLAGGELAAGEVQKQAKAAGLNFRTVQRAAEALGIVRKQAAFGGGWRWRLPQITHLNADDTQATNPTQEKQPVVLSSVEKQAKNDDSIRSHHAGDKLFSLGGEPVAFARGQDAGMRTPAGGVR